MKRITVIESRGPLRGLISLVMHSYYEVDGFSNEERIINDEIDPPDLFVVDQRREGENDIGIGVCRFLKDDQRYRNVPVIVLSGGQEWDEHVIAAGAKACLRKPFSLKSLRDIINTSTVKEYIVS